LVKMESVWKLANLRVASESQKQSINLMGITVCNNPDDAKQNIA